MTTTASGRHRKLRRNILHSVIVTALLAGTFTVADQSINATPVSAAAPAAPTAANSSVSADGTKINMKFNQTLSTNLPPKEQFKVTTGTYDAPTTRSVEIPVTNVERTALDVITLTLDGILDSNKPPQIQYTAPTIDNSPGNAAIQNVAGEDVANFTVASSGTQSLVPALVKGATTAVQAAGNTLQLTFNIALAAALPEESTFTVKTNGTTLNPVLSLTRPTTTTVMLTLRDGIERGTPVTVSYSAPPVDNVSATNHALQGTAGNDVQKFTDLTVANTVSLVPTLTSANVTAAGNILELNYNTFSGSLATNNYPATSAFTITYGDAVVGVSSVTATASKVVLTLARNVAPDKPVLVSYVAPSYNSASSNLAIQRSTGQDVSSFSNYAVGTNVSGAPYPISANAGTDGRTVIVTFSEAISVQCCNTSLVTVFVDGVARAHNDFRLVSSSGDGQKQVKLGFGSIVINMNQVVTVSYNAPPLDNTTANTSAIQDLIGTDSPSFINFPVTNSSTQDKIPPILLGAVVSEDGLRLTLTYNEALMSRTLSSSKFTIFANGVSKGNPSNAIISASPNNTVVNLSLSSPLIEGQVIEVTYVGAYDTGSIFDLASNQAPNFTRFLAENLSTVDKTPPVLQGIEVPESGDRLILTYDETLGSTLPELNTTNFGVTVDGVAWIPSVISTSGSQLILSGSASIGAGATVVLTKYVAPTPSESTTNAAIQDVYGNDAASLTNVAVTNNSIIDLPPNFISAAVDSTGLVVTLFYNETLSATTALKEDFQVISNGVILPVSSVEISGYSVKLTVSSPIGTGTQTTFTYAAPTSDPAVTNNAIQDIAGNDAAAILTPTQIDTSASSVDGVAPTLLTAVMSNSSTVSLAFDKTLANTPPDVSKFKILNGTTEIAVIGVSVVGSRIVLTLANGTNGTSGVTVEYLPDAIDISSTTNLAIQNTSGFDAAGFGPSIVEGADAKLCFESGSSTKLADGIYAITGAAEIAPSPADLVKNGDFSANDSASVYLERHWGPATTTKAAISNWTATGGGANTYGRASQLNGTSATKWYSIDPSSNATKTILYFGNYYVKSTTWDRVWDLPASGWVTRPITFVQPNPTSGEADPNLDNKFYGTSPLGIQQALTTIPGKSYRLQFFAGRELGSYTKPGIAALTIGSQTMHFRVDVPGSESNGEGTRYTVDFKATSTSTLIKFASYGHLPERDAGSKSTELALDTVRAIECGSPIQANPDFTSGGMGVTQTINLLSNADGGTDTSQPGASLVPSSVKLCSANESAPCTRTSLTVVGVGSYSVDSTGLMTFTPEPTYLGTPPAIRYSVEDTAGAIGMSTYTPTVADIVGPELSQLCVDGTGQTLTLTFNETIATAPSAADFTVTAGGEPVGVKNISVVGSQVQLTLATRIYPDQSPSVSYLPVDEDAAMQDTYDNDALPFTSEITCFASPMKYCTTGATPTQLVDGVYAMSGAGYIDPTLPNLVQNGRFNVGLESKTFGYFGEFMTNPLGGSSRARHAIPSWTSTGGGAWTYGSHNKGNTANFQTDPVDTGSPARVYFGNATSTNIKWDGTWTHPTVGWSNATIDMGIHSNPNYTNSTRPGPVAIAQDLVTETGKVYRLQFFAGREFGSYQKDGIAGLRIEGYQQLYFKVDAFGSGTRYTVDFVAKNSTTNLMFQNWGHAMVPGGETTELTIDTISVSDCNAPMAQADITSGPIGEVQTTNLLLNRDGYDSPSEGESLVPSSVKLCAANEVAPNCTKTSIVVTGVGSYSVNEFGVMTFTPLPDYIGTPPPISYTVEDTSGAMGVSTYTPTVTPPPMTARPDTTSGPQGATQTIDLTTNDIASDGATITKSSIKLCNVSATPGEVSPNCTVPVGTPVVVPGVGSYVVDVNGIMTFTPEANYVGTPPALPYVIQDLSGSQGASTYTPSVYGPPVANPDTITTSWDVNQTYTPLNNDTAGAGTTLNLDSIKICTTSTATSVCSGTTLVVAGEGTYIVNSDGTVTFDPLPTLTGEATPIKYVITDSENQIATSTITPIILPPPAPSASPDTITTDWDVSQTYSPLSNDTANASFPLLANSVKLCASNESPNNCSQTTLIVAGEGTYTVNSDGTVTFDPLPTFTGTATGVTYQAKDNLNRFVDSTITPIIGAPPAPSASPDAQSTDYDVTQIYTPTSNDIANTNFPLDITTVKLCQPATTNPPVSAEVPPNCTLTSLTTVDGVYTVNTTTGEVEFNPASTFSGTVANPINYQVTDSINRTITSTITPTIGPPPGPTAAPDTSTGNYDTNQTIDPLANDPDNPAIPLLPATLKLCGINPIETPNNCTQTSLFVPGEGSYVLDPATGLVTFDPLPTFSGTATPIKYQAANDAGQVVNSTITVTVGDPPLPVAKPDSSSSAMRVVQTINPLGNDTAGVSPVPLDPTTVKLCGIDPVETPNDCTKTTLIVPGKGTFSVDPVNGLVSFTPLDTFNGTVPPINYTVADTLAREVSSQINIVVLPPPAMAAITDLSSGNYNTPQTITPLTNDSPGDLTAPELSAYTVKGDVEKDPTSVRFCGTDDPATTLVDESVSPNCVATSITTAAGTYVVNTTTGVVTFTPVATFTGTDPNAPTYQTCNKVTGTWEPGTPPDTCASALIIPTVGEPPLPIASPDTSTGNYDTNQTINPLSNDTANENFPLDQTTLKLCGAGETLPNCSKTTLTVLNEGTYTVDPITGVVIFDPLPSFTGAATPISYQVSDSLGREVTSTISVTVGEPPLPTAANDTNSGPFDTDQIISPLTNDSPIAAFPFDQTTVKLCATGISPPNCDSLRVETADGVYTVNPDGTVTFNPDPDFTGVATSVTYQVTETKIDGRTASATITPTVGPPPLATATPDAQTSAHDTNQTYTPTSNDTANAFFPISPTSVKLCATGENPPTCTATTLTVANEGTYTIDPNTGVVTFDPLPSFTGVATPITYQASDLLDRVVNSTITPTVGPPPAPIASPDAQTQPYDTDQVYTPTSNDTANDDFPITASSLRLCGPDNLATKDIDESVPPNCVALRVVTADGVYTVDPTTGVVTFNPDPDFTGLATEPVTYQATDSLNRVLNSTITPTVGPPPLATATPDAQTSAHDTNQTYTPTSNDTANAFFPISPTSVKLCATGENPPTCTATTLTVANEGTYTIDPNTGVVTFDPLPSFTGVATPITYQASDLLDRVVNSTITPTIREPQAVTVLPDTSSDAWDVTQTKSVLANDTPGSTAFPFLANTVKICDTNEVYPNCSKSTVTIANQGTYTVNSDGTISFDPLPTFFGTATPIKYQAGDGKTTDWSTYTPTVEPPPAPIAQPDVTSGAMGKTQTINLLTNASGADSAGISGVTLDPTSVKLCGEGEASPNCAQTTVAVAGVGTYSVSNGVMTFTPEANFTGTPAPLAYTVLDSTGQKASSTYTPTVIPPPTVVPDTTTAGWDVTQSMDVVTGVTTKGSFDESLNTGDSAAEGATLVAGSLRLCSLSDIEPDCTVGSSGSVVIPNQGTYTVDPTSGFITFDPLPTFIGTAMPVTYSVTDDLGQKSSTTYTPTVVVPVPVATPEVKKATLVLVNPSDTTDANLNFGDMQWTTIFTSVLEGNGALATGSGLESGTTNGPCLIDPVTSVCSASVTIPGEGIYNMDQTTGVVTFVSEVVVYDPSGSNITPGPKTAISYRVTDSVGQTATSTLTPIIPKPPVANPDFSTGVQGAIQTISPVGNDRPGGGASTELYPDERTEKPSGIYLCAANQPPPDCRATTVEVIENDVLLGTLTVADSGLVTFTPEPDFVGTTPPIGYQIPDNLGQKAYSTITITVVPPPAPSATIDTGSAEYNQPVTLRPWINDAPGTRPDNSMRSDGTPYPAPNLVATSIKLCDDNSTFVAMSGTPADCTATKIKTVEGTYEVNATTGEVVFTPVNGFTGTVKYPPTYQIWNDWTGLGGAKSATALLVPTIAPPGAPAANVDVTKTKPGTSVVLNPVSNDKPGSYALDPTTIRLCGTGEISPACTQMSVTTLDGLYVVDPTSGQVTFTPRDGFTGQATIPYVIHDARGMAANSHLIITVEDTAVVAVPEKDAVVAVPEKDAVVAVPVVKKTKVGLAKTGGTRPDLLLLLGILAIAAAGGLRVLGRKK